MSPAETAADLTGAVVAIAGAGGPAGQAACARLHAAGAIVIAGDVSEDRLAAAVAPDPERILARPVDLLDLDATRAWSDAILADHGRLDGLVHLVGGWRGSKSFADLDLADWDALERLLIRTVQHTSLATYEALAASDRGRYILVSASGASKPTAGNAAYASAKAAAEAWTLALGNQFAKTGGEDGPAAAASILVVKALLTDQMRADKPDAKFAGFTHVTDLAEAITGLWSASTADLNGTRQWLTPQS